MEIIHAQSAQLMSRFRLKSIVLHSFCSLQWEPNSSNSMAPQCFDMIASKTYPSSGSLAHVGPKLPNANLVNLPAKSSAGNSPRLFQHYNTCAPGFERLAAIAYPFGLTLIDRKVTGGRVDAAAAAAAAEKWRRHTLRLEMKQVKDTSKTLPFGSASTFRSTW